jgi:sugar lactone lactonase YvrE
MQSRNLRLRLRAGWLPTLSCAVVGIASACSSGDGNTTPTPTPTPTPNPTVAGDAEVTGLRALAAGQIAPLDSTPDPQGNRVYFTALSGPATTVESAGQGVVMATSRTGEAPTLLASGFSTPVQVVTSIDGATVFVADSAIELRAADSVDEADIGAVFRVPSAGGEKAEVTSTRGYRPRGLDVKKLDSTEWLYFVGVDPADGMPGVFRTASLGGAVEVVKKGEPFGNPSCVAVANNGDVYVTDSGSRTRTGSVFKVSGGAVTVLVPDVNMATPAGLALSESEKFLLVSALKPREEGATAAVLRVDLTTNTAAVFDDGISGNYNSAGIHRAHSNDTFTWADSAGTVYLVGTKKSPLP